MKTPIQQALQIIKAVAGEETLLISRVTKLLEAEKQMVIDAYIAGNPEYRTKDIENGGTVSVVKGIRMATNYYNQTYKKK